MVQRCSNMFSFPARDPAAIERSNLVNILNLVIKEVREKIVGRSSGRISV